MQESALLHFSETHLQEIALLLMAVVYFFRVRWMFGFGFGKERQARTGRLDTNAHKGVAYSMFNIAMPWAMESTRRKPFFYAQFVLFHLGVVAAISLSFIIPYAPLILDNSWFVWLLQAVIGAACLVGCGRIIRRVSVRVLRAISTPDDYFSLILLTFWFFFAFLSVPNDPATAEWPLLTFFILTAFFLVYVPFSKISHYLYYPFGRYFLGKTLGYRGVFPVQRGPKARTVR